jgi:CheY-like chemotaxis protein
VEVADRALRVLVAEDQPVNWTVMERLLTKRGYEAVSATDGNRVLAMLASERFDLVFMDCQMPILDGYETTREIRRREQAEGRPRMPIIAMTANAMAGAAEQCIAAGMDDYLAKPVSRVELDEKLAGWLPNAAGEHHPPLAATADPAEDAVLDEARLDELRSLFPGDEMSEMLANLTAEVTEELDRLNAAVSERDRAVHAAAHRIKNSARMIGAAGLAEAASQLEPHFQPAGTGSPATGDEALQQLRERWEATRAEIEAELARGR